MALASFFFAFLAYALPTALAGSPTTGMPIYPGGDQSKCLGVVGGNLYNGAQVDIYDCNDSDSQKWFMHYGTTQISTAFGNYCLDAGLPPFDNNRVLTIWECYDGLAQQTWDWSEKHTTVTLHDQGKCMDLTNGSKDNRNLIQIYDCYPANGNQMWTHTNIQISDPSGGHSSNGNSSCQDPNGYYCQGFPPPDAITTTYSTAYTTSTPYSANAGGSDPHYITTYTGAAASSTPSAAYAAGNAVLSGALEGSSDSSGSSDGFAKWAPVVVGLLAANLVVSLALIVVFIMNYVRKGGKDSSRSIAPSYYPTREHDAEAFMEKPSFRDD